MRFAEYAGLLVVSVSVFVATGCDLSQEPYVSSVVHAPEVAPEPVPEPEPVEKSTVEAPVSDNSDSMRAEIRLIQEKIRAMKKAGFNPPSRYSKLNSYAIEAEYESVFIGGKNGEDDMVRGREDDPPLFKSHAVRIKKAPEEGLLLPDLELRRFEGTADE